MKINHQYPAVVAIVLVVLLPMMSGCVTQAVWEETAGKSFQDPQVIGVWNAPAGEGGQQLVVMYRENADDQAAMRPSILIPLHAGSPLVAKEVEGNAVGNWIPPHLSEAQTNAIASARPRVRNADWLVRHKVLMNHFTGAIATPIGLNGEVVSGFTMFEAEWTLTDDAPRAGGSVKGASRSCMVIAPNRISVETPESRRAILGAVLNTPWAVACDIILAPVWAIWLLSGQSR